MDGNEISWPVVLIVTDKEDVSSHIVAQYLECLNLDVEFLYSCGMDEFSDLSNLKDGLNKYRGIWLRRGQHFLRGSNWNSLFEAQRKTIDDYIHYAFENSSNCIGSLFAEYNHNKLIDLKLAEISGLTTPETYLISRKQSLIEIIEKSSYKKFITKSVKNSVRIMDNDNLVHYGYTLRINTLALKLLPDTFYPSLVQEEINKAYEVRVFYLKGICYSMAIFSQHNAKTQLDYRYYDDDKSNRAIPFQLESSMEENIDRLMQSKGLNCGSIDLIVDIKGEYYFLEVNPVGQFGWLSINCNYYLEKHIASVLANESNMNYG